MKVNVVGRGFIPGPNSIAPVYNQEMTETQIRRVLNITSLRVFDASTGLIITKKNINKVFESMNETTSVEQPAEQVETITTPPVVDDVVDETIVTENVVETVDEVIAEDVVDEQTETVDDMNETVEEVVGETSDAVEDTAESEDETTEETPDEKPYYNKNKKKKHNRY